MITAQQNLESYPTLCHYRNAASHRSTFHQTILSIQSTMKLYLQKINETNNNKENRPPQNNAIVITRTVPTRQRIYGVVPKPMQFGVSLPFITPKKVKKQIEQSGDMSDSLNVMYHSCTGRLVQVVDNTKKQRCDVCKKTTPYYCAGCKSWFCFASRLTDKKKGNREDLNMIYHCLKCKREFFFNSCYAIKHQEAWKREDAQTSTAITTLQQSVTP